MHINNGTPTLSSASVNTQSQLLSDQKALEGNTLPSAETAVPANKPENSSNQHRQSSAYLLSIGTQDQQTSLTYSAKSQYSISSNHSNYTSSSTTTITASSAVNEPPALLDGARNILSFIEQRIASEQAAGASLETLDTLLQQGLAGFTQGYDEARAILGEQDSLNDAVDDSISLLYQQVVDGINDLRHSYLGEAKMEPTAVAQQATAPPVDASAQQIAPATSKQSPSLNSSLTNPINNLMDELSGSPDAKILTLLDSLEKIDEVREYAAEYAETKEFSFNLTTADGDTVTINASRASSVSAYNNTDGNQGLSITQGNQQQQFSFAIDGELDDGEMEAINDLMQQVMSLSEQFYNGDIGEAYEAALAMDYDSTEITSYALQLKQTESYEVAAIYDEVAPSTFSPAADLHSVFETIGDYTQQVLKGILDSGNHQQSHYAQMIEAVAQQLDHQLDQQLNKETGTDLYQFSDSVATMMELV